MNRSRLTLVALVALPGLALLGGCQLLIGLDGGKPGGGGAGGTGSSSSSTTTSSSTTSSSTTTSSTSSSTGAGGSGGHGGMPGTGGMGGATSSSTSSTTTSSSSGASCDGGTTCSALTDCPVTGNECVDRTCPAGCCETANVPALTAIAAQTTGDCKKVTCDGSGGTTTVIDDTDKPADQDACNQGDCSSGATKQLPRAAGTACNFGGGKVCGDPVGAAAGTCVECNTAANCGAGQVCAANKCSALVLLAASAAGTFGATFQSGDVWSGPTALGGLSTDDLALAFTTTGLAVGAFRIVKATAASEQVWYTTWTAGAWATAVAIDGTSVFTQSAPSVSAGSTAAQLVFHGTDFKYYYASFSGGVWSPKAEPVGGATQSFGPTGSALAAIAGNATVVFFDGNNSTNQITAQNRTAGAWGTTTGLSGADTSSTTMPTIVALKGGTADLLAMYPRTSGVIAYRTRTGGVWSGASTVSTASTGTFGRPALAALPGGQAIMAFRGNDTNLYYATYNGVVWTTPTLVLPAVSVSTVPVLARGLGGTVAEIAFVKASDSFAYHARFDGAAWSAPVKVGTQTASHVAIATFP
jgi:hypothetical protein